MNDIANTMNMVRVACKTARMFDLAMKASIMIAVAATAFGAFRAVSNMR